MFIHILFRNNSCPASNLNNLKITRYSQDSTHTETSLILSEEQYGRKEEKCIRLIIKYQISRFTVL